MGSQHKPRTFRLDRGPTKSKVEVEDPGQLNSAVLLELVNPPSAHRQANETRKKEYR